MSAEMSTPESARMAVLLNLAVKILFRFPSLACIRRICSQCRILEKPRMLLLKTVKVDRKFERSILASYMAHDDDFVLQLESATGIDASIT